MQCKDIFQNTSYIRSHLLQFVLLIVSQLIYYFSKGEVAKREPILSYVYKSYEHTHFPNFGGGIIGFYLLKLFVPLISIAGIIIVTLILLISSFILLLKLHHRDVARNTIDYFKRSTQSASSTLKEKEKQIKLEEKNDYVKKKNSVKHWHTKEN